MRTMSCSVTTSIRGEFRTKVLLDDALTFEKVKDELRLREQHYSETEES